MLFAHRPVRLVCNEDRLYPLPVDGAQVRLAVLCAAPFRVDLCHTWHPAQAFHLLTMLYRLAISTELLRGDR
jgi:hypothetical protein